MTIEVSNLVFQNTGDVATDLEVSLSTFEGIIHDGVWIKFYVSETGDFNGEEKKLDASTDVGLFPKDNYSSELTRLRSLLSDEENFVKAVAESINWEEQSSFGDAFNSEGFEQSWQNAGQPGTGFEGVPPQ